MASAISGPGREALNTLSPSQIAFIQSLPKAELHAHLNGSIPIALLQDLAREFAANATSSSGDVSAVVQAGVESLQRGVELREIGDFFGLFPAIYALTSTPAALRRATRAVLHDFLHGEHPQCTYLELRTGPRETPAMSRMEYMRAVLEEVERFPADKAAVILSLDRKMEDGVFEECVEIAKVLREEGRRVVGIDLCGDPTVGNMDTLSRHIKEAKNGGLGITLHIAETLQNTHSETLQLLSYGPDRLGHATFLNEEAKSIVLKNKTCIEICLTSNLLSKTVGTLDDHHIRYYLERDHPIAICTDDTLPFRNSMLGEYALLIAQPPLGLGLAQKEVHQVAKMSLASRFRQR